MSSNGQAGHARVGGAYHALVPLNVEVTPLEHRCAHQWASVECHNSCARLGEGMVPTDVQMTLPVV